MPSERSSAGTRQMIRRRCTNCGDEWSAKRHALGNGYDCSVCGAPGREIETVRCTVCGDPIGEEWVRTDGKAHPECAEERYAE